LAWGKWDLIRRKDKAAKSKNQEQKQNCSNYLIFLMKE
jgi:hypothetical protein